MPKRNTFIVWCVIIVAILFFAFIYFSRTAKNQEPITSTDPMKLPGMQASTTPWIAEIAHLKERLAADNLPALATEGTKLHIHQHLDLFINGTVVPIPTDIGVHEAAHFISPIHVHDTSSVIHVESPFVATFTLGQFFDVWGVKFTQECIGGYCTENGKSISVFVNGEPYTGDFRTLPLTAHAEIVISYGTASDTPAVIPSSYEFPAGY